MNNIAQKSVRRVMKREEIALNVLKIMKEEKVENVS